MILGKAGQLEIGVHFLKLEIGLFQEPVKPLCIKKIFEARFFAVRAVRMLDENMQHGSARQDGLFRCADDPGGARQILVTGNAAKRYAAIDAFLYACVIFLDFDGLKTDVIAVADRRDRSTTIKGC